MRNLNDINDLYNVQDVILFLQIIGNRFEQMYKKYYYNPRKWNLYIALLASSGNIETPTDGFRCVNIRLDFDTKILLPNLTQRDFNKMDITEIFKAFKKDDLTICYKLKLDGEKNYSDQRVIAKILKLN